MYRSRFRNLPPRFKETPLAAALLLLSPSFAAAADGDTVRAIEEVVVTAQKRS
jgi:outer membrane cobalamin receptor